jgi:hypothetical protein
MASGHIGSRGTAELAFPAILATCRL